MACAIMGAIDSHKRVGHLIQGSVEVMKREGKSGSSPALLSISHNRKVNLEIQMHFPFFDLSHPPFSDSHGH